MRRSLGVSAALPGIDGRRRGRCAHQRRRCKGLPMRPRIALRRLCCPRAARAGTRPRAARGWPRRTPPAARRTRPINRSDVLTAVGEELRPGRDVARVVGPRRGSDAEIGAGKGRAQFRDGFLARPRLVVDAAAQPVQPVAVPGALRELVQILDGSQSAQRAAGQGSRGRPRKRPGLGGRRRGPGSKESTAGRGSAPMPMPMRGCVGPGPGARLSGVAGAPCEWIGTWSLGRRVLWNQARRTGGERTCWSRTPGATARTTSRVETTVSRS